jgi:hypothetical protein
LADVPPVSGVGPTVHWQVHALAVVVELHGTLFVVSMQNVASPHTLVAFEYEHGDLSE